MKKSILAMVAFTFISGAILTSCNSSAEKTENAEKNVTEANKELDKANEAYLADIDNCRRETTNKIAANDQRIAELKAGIENIKKDAKADYKKTIAELEQKNTDIKKKMDDYKADGKEKWEIFKTEFNHDMDELGKAFKDITVKNVK
jgi:peptidoglycan hydrolase CwlO-like protein